MSFEKTYDVHHHVFPPETPVHHWDIYTDHEAMQRCGVTNVLLSCPLQTNAKFAHYTNELLAEQVKVWNSCWMPAEIVLSTALFFPITAIPTIV